MGRLQGKVALVSGAGRGIGRAMARLYAQEGASVAVLSLTASNVERTVGEINAAGGTAIGIPCDIADVEQVNAAVAKVVETYGRLDILVNNAFEFSTAMAPVKDLPVAQLQRQLALGPIAYLQFMQACYPHLAREGGRVINFGSAVGITGTEGFAPYAMAKEAVRALTRVAAREWGAANITVNNILPIARTDAYDASTAAVSDYVPSTPIPRLGSPEEDIAPVALFLASKDSQFLTGYTFTPDGGFLIDAAR